MSQFVNQLIGGIVIGISSSMMLYFLGRITGISGICANILNLKFKDNDWRIFFILGLILGGFFMKYFNPSYFNFEIKGSAFQMIFAGLLVGFGTRLGSGCTSGRGVCGIPRLSKRSIIATLIFMFSGIVTVTLMRLI